MSQRKSESELSIKQKETLQMLDSQREQILASLTRVLEELGIPLIVGSCKLYSPPTPPVHDAAEGDLKITPDMDCYCLSRGGGWYCC